MRKLLFPGVFTFLMISALAVRIIAARYGLPYIYNFDEPNNTSAALQMMKTGDFNPHTFNYGTLLPYLDYLSDVVNYLSLMGRPDTANSYLTSMNDIHAGGVGNDGVWLWSISHPSFYFWNRMISVVLGLATIVMTFILTEHVTGNRWCALVAVAVLASLGIHVTHSAYTTPDGPTACFILGAVLFAYRFRMDGRRDQLLFSLVFCGLAVATKFGSALVIVMPITAFLVRRFYDRQKVEMSWLLFIPTVPAVVMFLAEPYSILDSTTFLRDVGFEIRHYKVLGHDDHMSRPGIGQVLFQLSEFYNNLGLIDSVIVAIGLAITLFSRARYIALYPMIYILYMAQMRVNFHRNFVQVYPFLAVFIAVGVHTAWQAVERHGSGAALRRTAIAFFVLFSGSQVVSSWVAAAHTLSERDTRSRLVDVMNRLRAVSTLVVPGDLHIHEQDLRRLKAAYRVVHATEIASLCSRPAGGMALVLPQSLAEDGETSQEKADTALYATLSQDADSDPSTIYRADGVSLSMHSPMHSPGLIVVPLSAKICADAGAR